MSLLARLTGRKPKAELTESKPLSLTYWVRVRNTTTGNSAPAYSAGGYTDTRQMQKEIAAISTGDDPLVVEIVEAFSGGGMPEGNRVLHTQVVAPARQKYLHQRVQDLRYDLCSAIGGSIREFPLQRKLEMETLTDGQLQMRLVEYGVQITEKVLRYEVRSTKRVLDACLVNPDDGDSTPESADFLADAQASITEYERARRAVDTDAQIMAEDARRRAQDADRLRSVLEQTMAEINRGHAASL